MGIELGKIVREKMQALGLTYQKTADLAGITKDYVYKIIQGQRNPEPETLSRLAEVLQLDKKELLFISYRDRVPEEVKDYLGTKLKTVRTLDLGRIFRQMMPRAEYVIEDRFSKKYIELAKKIAPWAEKAIENEKDFVSQFREAQNQVAMFLGRGFPDTPHGQRAGKLFQEFEKLEKKAAAQREKESRKEKKEILGFELPLLREENPQDPAILFAKGKKPEKSWKLVFEKTADEIPFTCQINDDSMTPLIQKKDTVLGVTNAFDKIEDLIGKVVVAKIKGLGVIVRHYNRKEKKVILTALNPSFPPHILGHGEIEWLHPVKGIYREF